MKIRTQLVALVSGVMLPLVVLAALVTYSLWHQQRQAYQQQFLERANALRLALDTEFEVTLRALKATGESIALSAPDVGPRLQRRFDGFLANNPDWIAVGALDSQGHLLVSSARGARLAMPPVATEGIRQTINSRSAFISDLQATSDGTHVVYLATALVRDGAAAGAVFAVIDHRHWLEFLRAYPVSERAVLSLSDTSLTVITRTLDDERWVGKTATAAFRKQTVGQSSGSFQTNSLDGTPIYAAFSHSKVSGWLLSTGVPRDEVEAALRGQTMTVVIVLSLAMLGALLAAWFLGRHVNTSMTALERSARSLSNPQEISGSALPIQEAETVRQAMVDAHSRLLGREASLNAALMREEAAREQAESGSRAKDRFLAMMGHELRNPMSAITAAAEILGKDGILPTVMVRTRDIIKRQASRMGAMINDLMDVAQLGSGDLTLHRARLDLARVTLQVVDRFTDSGRCSHVDVKLEHVPAWIDADQERMAQIITNILDNACKYTLAGGTVTVTVRGEEQWSILSVRDSGVGIAAQLAASMFDAFTQGERSIERSQGGLGLGLTLARWLVELHGGAISASSDGTGTGATFTVRLPSAEPPRKAVTPAKTSADLLLTVVEDIEDTREMMQMLLGIDGRRVNAAADGPSGVETILAGPSDIAVVDIGLPGFDGFEVARRVRKASGGEQILLIALTGYGSDADRAKAEEAGFDQFLVKPFDVERFEAAVDAGLRDKRESMT